jgi:protocatechuate 3,4-dioxygenase beta subunit
MPHAYYTGWQGKNTWKIAHFTPTVARPIRVQTHIGFPPDWTVEMEPILRWINFSHTSTEGVFPLIARDCRTADVLIGLGKT